MKVFVGYDIREDIAFQVCEHSVYKHQPQVQVLSLKQSQLRDSGVYTRDIEFTFTRFLVPYLTGYKGWAVFVDCDVVVVDDIKKLFDQADEQYAVMVVKHDYTPKEGVKMDGCKQLPYPRKNWSSMILWNCGHPANQQITPDLVNSQTGQYLHRFQWLSDSQIGSLDPEWNWLAGWYHEPTDGQPKIIHYTEGGPWFKEYRRCDYHKIWKQYLREMLK